MVTSVEGINFHVSYSSTNINWRLEFKGTASLGTKRRVFGAFVAAKWDFIHFLVRVNRIKELIWITNMSVFYKFCTRFFSPNSLLESQDQWMICQTSLQLPKLWSHLAQGSPSGFCSVLVVAEGRFRSLLSQNNINLKLIDSLHWMAETGTYCAQLPLLHQQPSPAENQGTLLGAETS